MLPNTQKGVYDRALLFHPSRRFNWRHVWYAFQLIRLMIGTFKINRPRAQRCTIMWCCKGERCAGWCSTMHCTHMALARCKCLVTKINVVHYRFPEQEDGNPNRPTTRRRPSCSNLCAVVNSYQFPSARHNWEPGCWKMHADAIHQTYHR